MNQAAGDESGGFFARLVSDEGVRVRPDRTTEAQVAD
jgi:hypothetical protein